MNKNLITILILALVGVLVFVVFVKEKLPEKYTYSGLGGKYNFTVDSSKLPTLHVLNYDYTTKNFLKKNVNIPFEYSPMELENIKVPNGLKKKVINSKGIFITSDPYLTESIDLQDQVATLTISRITGSEEYNFDPHIFEIDTFSANTREYEGSQVPVLTCSNATETGRIIHLKQGSKNEIYYDSENENCVVLEYVKPKDVVKVATRLVYSLLNIMP